MAMTLTSPAFKDDQKIPAKYTCQGEDVSPPLQWSEVPEEAKSLALVCEDHDAPMGITPHWIIYHIPPDAEGLPEGVPPEKELEGGAMQGLNAFKKVGYRGPCPPRGGPHRYFFRLFALDRALDLNPSATRAELLKAMKRRVLEEAELMGRYQRV